MGKILVEKEKREEINTQTSKLMAKSDHKNKYYDADDQERAMTDESAVHNYSDSCY